MEKEMSDEREIKRVRLAETSRGAKTELNLARKTKRLENLLLSALESGNKTLFEQTLSELGQQPGTEAYRNSMKIFDQHQR
jgi:hypothetical protein